MQRMSLSAFNKPGSVCGNCRRKLVSELAKPAQGVDCILKGRQLQYRQRRWADAAPMTPVLAAGPCPTPAVSSAFRTQSWVKLSAVSFLSTQRCNSQPAIHHLLSSREPNKHLLACLDRISQEQAFPMLVANRPALISPYRECGWRTPCSSFPCAPVSQSTCRCRGMHFLFSLLLCHQFYIL